jgi:acyl carrier protein
MIEEKLKNIIAEQLGIEVTTIASTADLTRDLGADSIDIVEIIMTLEKEFNISIEECEAAQHPSVDSIVTLIQEKLV